MSVFVPCGWLMWFLLLRRNPWSSTPCKRLIIPFDVTIPGISAIVIPYKCRPCSHYYRLEVVRNFEFQTSNEHWWIQMDGLRLLWNRTSCLKLWLFWRLFRRGGSVRISTEMRNILRFLVVSPRPQAVVLIEPWTWPFRLFALSCCPSLRHYFYELVYLKPCSTSKCVVKLVCNEL